MVLAQYKNFHDTLFLTFITLATLMPRFGAIDNNSIRWFAVSLVSITYLFKHLRLGRSKLLISKNHALYAGSLLFYLFLSIFISKNPIEGVITIYKVICLIVTFFISYDIFKKKNSFITVCTVFSVSLFVEGLVILIQFSDSFKGLTGVALNPNISSSSIIIKLPFILFLIQKVKNKWYKILIKMIEYMSIIGVVILGSRLGLISLFLIYLFYFSWYKNYRLTQAFSICVIITFNFYVNNLRTEGGLELNTIKIENLTKDESTNQRFNFYKKAVKLSFKKPLLGYGLGSWKYESLPYEKNNNRNILVPYYTHNDFLQIFFELGVLGLLVYLIFLSTLFKRILPLQSKFKGVLFITFLMFLLNSFLNFPLHRSQEIIPFILVSSMIFSISKKGDEAKSKLSPYMLIFVIIPVLVLSFLEHNSLKMQEKLISDYNLGTFSLAKNEINNINYIIPNLSATGVPISTYISRYHFESKEYNKSLSLLNHSSKANYKDLMTQELLLKNYIFLGKNILAIELSKKLMSIYPKNSLYSEIYFSLTSENRTKD
tara:strand:+ start:3458 stop:5089 length:1632 start_codon:yes stop_codon:yes gene_type:complete